MKQIIFATNNKHKLSEIRQIVGPGIQILGLADIGCTYDIPETGSTLRENAEIKARYVARHYGLDCFADDTGLIVDALGGEPGVRSARYAMEEGDHNSAANMAKLLRNLEDKADRSACFETVIALIHNGELHFFSGRVDGVILREPVGDGGFGYDPVFKPLESDAPSFAAMTPEQKNAISHRGRATARLISYLSQNL